MVQTNNLDLNVTKTKEMVVHFRREKKRSHYASLKSYGTLLEKVSSYRYLRVHIYEALTWTTHINSLVMKARQRLYHLRRLKKFKISTGLQKTFSPNIQSVISGSYLNCLLSCLLASSYTVPWPGLGV